jgi:transposase
MPKSYSVDLRKRVIEAVEAGASRREAAERFEVDPSSAVRWLQRWTPDAHLRAAEQHGDADGGPGALTARCRVAGPAG